jgi:CRP/FNR family transcriptional regulator, cyclic AMP receptor protein
MLLLPAYFSKDGVPETVIPKINQEPSERWWAQPSGGSVFFNESFQKAGFVDYGGSSLQVHGSLLSVVLHD